MESKNKMRSADDIFSLGIARWVLIIALESFHCYLILKINHSRKAQPLEKIESVYTKFLVRSAQTIKIAEVRFLRLSFFS